MGKPKTDRTQQLHKGTVAYALARQANAAIELFNFTKLVQQGIVVLDRQAEQSMLNYEGRGRGKGAGGEL